MAKTTLAHLKRLIGNPDVLAEQHKDGTYRPVNFYPELLQQHLKGSRTFGTYVINPPDHARTLVLDVDDESLAKAKHYAFQLQDALNKLGVPDRSIGVEFSGKKGYHVWVVTWDYVPASTLRTLGLIATMKAGVECEVFPKQDRVGDGGFGNLVKLPGGVHRVTGKRNDYLLRAPQPMSRAVLNRILDRLPPLPEARSLGERPVALECMAHIQAGVGEGMRNHALFHFCAHARRASLDEVTVEKAAMEINSRFEPPLQKGEVFDILESSRDRGPICRQLPKEIQCSDCPILRPKGLYAKPGQVRTGAKGELVVVRIGKKDKGFVEFEHPDMSKAKAALR